MNIFKEIKDEFFISNELKLCFSTKTISQNLKEFLFIQMKQSKQKYLSF